MIDLNDKSYPYRKVFKNREIIESAGENCLFSPDGTKIAFLKNTYNPDERNIIYICSTEDGSLIKSIEFAAALDIPMYLDFFEAGRIAIYSDKYAFSPSYMCGFEMKGE